MYQPYQCCTRTLEEYYVNQAGSGLSYYQGSSLQQGHGLGGFFRSLFRGAIPLLKKGAKAFGKQALASTIDFASDLTQGADPKTAAIKRAKEAGNLLTEKAAGKVKSMIGQGRNKRKRKPSKVRSRSKASKVGSRSKVRKLQGRDIFG